MGRVPDQIGRGEPLTPRPPWYESGTPLAGNDRDLDWILDRPSECALPDELRAAAAARWEKQREHVVANSRFYHHKHAAAGVDLASVRLDDLPGVPLTTKSELQEAQELQPPFGDHLAVPQEEVKRVYQTSGTAGLPTLIALTRSDGDTWRKIGSRSYYATGIRPHNAVLITLAAGPFVAGHAHGVVDELGARAVPVGPGNTSQVLTALDGHLVDTVLTTPSYALYLIDQYEQLGVDAGRLGVIHLVTGGEPGGGLPGLRRRMEDAFAASVTEVMGLGEISPSLFGECPAEEGMHFAGPGLVWPELIDAEGEPVPIETGAQGELVLTHLQREAMPLVRFRTGDRVTVITTECACGRTSFTIRVTGRVDDMFIVRGANVYPSAVQAVVGAHIPRVTGRIRIVLPPTGTSIPPPVPIEVEVTNASDPNGELVARIEEAIRAQLSFRAAVSLVPQAEFGGSDHKTPAVVRRDRPG